MPWYKERHLTNISLGSLIILCVLRVVVYNLYRAKDPYLLSNCSAILLNLAPQAERIHEYTALRMISVLQTIMRRYLQKAESAHNSRRESSVVAPPEAPTEPPSPSPVSDTQSPKHFGLINSGVINAVLESSTTNLSTSATATAHPGHTKLEEGDQSPYLNLLQEAMRMLLNVFNICLRPSLIQNNLR